MAEQTALRNNALPYPIYGVPFGVTFPMLDADGDLVTGATTPDAEVSKNGDTFADCTNESTEIATNSGVYYLLLTGAEMTADVVTVIAKSATAGMKTTVLTLYPRKLVSLKAGTSQAGAAGSITLDASASAIDDYYNGCVVVGVLDSLTEARVITDYVGSTKVASVTPNWNTTPDSDDTFTIYLPEGRQIVQSDGVGWRGVNVATPNNSGYPMVDTIYIGGSNSNVSVMPGSISTMNSALGGIADAAADGDPTSSDTLVAYVKQLINTLVGSAGIPTWPAAAAPANAVSVSEALRWLADQVGTAGAGLTAADDAVIAAIPSAATNADAVWDEVRSGHVAAGSFGQATQTISGTATAGGASTITLAVGSSASDDFYNGLLICIVGGTGEGQNKFIADYTGATRVATVSGTWVTQPDNTSVYAIVGV